MRMRKICVVTSSRADYGLMSWLIRAIAAEPAMTLQIIATGAHLLPEYGMTIEEITQDGFVVDECVDIVSGVDSTLGAARSAGLCVNGVAEALSRLKPDIVVVYGDRYEMLAATYSAVLMGCPVAHVGGGECSAGAFDELFRHAITKLAHFHFVGSDEFRNRVIQMGEPPSRVWNVGDLCVDAIQGALFYTRKELSQCFEIPEGVPLFLMTYHPVTMFPEETMIGLHGILGALEAFFGFHVVITHPNADPGRDQLLQVLSMFQASHSSRVSIVPSLGQKGYLSVARESALVLGNSSSGLIEIPVLRIPSVNIGSRQQGRMMPKSVVDCPSVQVEKIAEAIRSALSEEHRRRVMELQLPYGSGGTGSRIKDILLSISLESSLQKVFCNFS